FFVDFPGLWERIRQGGGGGAEAEEKSPAKGEKSTKKELEPDIANSIGMQLKLIRPGRFTMGSPPTEKHRDLNEGPIHEVTISQPYYLGVYEVTQAEYRRIMGTNPSAFSADGKNSRAVTGLDTDRFPVENVTRVQAEAFCRHLSTLPEEMEAGRVYRLPTEAQAEYACRAGTSARFSFGDVL